MQVTLLPHEIDYIKSLVAGAEQTLFSNDIITKLSNPTVLMGNKAVRKTDPNTSKAGASSIAMRAGSQRHTLLSVYADAIDGLTDEEAGINSGLANKPKCCYWKRCSELRQAGYIAVTGLTRASTVKEQQQVCIITQKGLEALQG